MDNTEKALLGVTVVGGVGVGTYLLWEYFLKGALDGNGECCAENAVECIEDVTWKCTSCRWVNTGTPCTTAWPCSNCEAEGCALVFDTYEALAAHLSECHGTPALINRGKVFESVDHPKGAQVFEYWFCRTYSMSLITGLIVPSNADRPPFCTPSFEVYVLSRGSWYSLGDVEMRAGEDIYLPTTFAFAPTVPVDAIRFRGHGHGFWCGGWDARALQVNFETAVSIADPAQQNRACLSQLVGWKVTTW